MHESFKHGRMIFSETWRVTRSALRDRAITGARTATPATQTVVDAALCRLINSLPDLARVDPLRRPLSDAHLALLENVRTIKSIHRDMQCGVRTA